MKTLETSIHTALEQQQSFFTEQIFTTNQFHEQHKKLVDKHVAQSTEIQQKLTEALLTSRNNIDKINSVSNDTGSTQLEHNSKLKDRNEDTAKSLSSGINRMLEAHKEEQSRYQKQFLALCEKQTTAMQKQQQKIENVSEHLIHNVNAIMRAVDELQQRNVDYSNTAKESVNKFAESFNDTFSQQKMDLVSEMNSLLSDFISKQQTVVFGITKGVSQTLDEQEASFSASSSDIRKLVTEAETETTTLLTQHKEAVNSATSELKDESALISASADECMKKMENLSDRVEKVIVETEKQQIEDISSIETRMITLQKECGGIAIDAAANISSTTNETDRAILRSKDDVASLSSEVEVFTENLVANNGEQRKGLRRDEA